MGILDRLSPSSQFIEVIEWLDDSSNTLVYRFPVKDQEIKNGAQLIVRESQAAVFVHEGQIADQFPPGRYTIDGGNTPILSKLGAWKYGFNSPFKAEVYFVNTKQFTDLKWGTPNPVMMRDSDFGMVRLRAVRYLLDAHQRTAGVHQGESPARMPTSSRKISKVNSSERS
jgi:membrane protease subunit (stomatin/prohibitin family)